MRSVLLVFAISWWLQGCYVLKLAYIQNNLINSRIPVAAAVRDPTIEPEVRQALMRTREILQYAKTQGLNVADAYRYYVPLDRPAVSYTVSAAFPDKLAFHTWWFPIVGDVPYLGFFSREERDEKATQLAEQGFDIAHGTVGAFSSLGWFDDPIYTPMLRRPDYRLTHLIFHELVHRTLWFRGNVRFNENIAEFVAGIMTENVLQEEGESEMLSHYRAEDKDRAKFAAWIESLRSALEELYARPLEWPKMANAKQEIFDTYLAPPHRPKFDVLDYIGNRPWNNATVLASSLYVPDDKAFRKAFECVAPKRISAFLEAVEAVYQPGKDMEQMAAELCNEENRLVD